jgi:hypothetical protein
MDDLKRKYDDLQIGVNVADTIVVNTEAWLPLRERLLFLFRPVMITTRVGCEIAPGKTGAVVVAWAKRWRWPWQHNGAYESVPRLERTEETNGPE